MNVLKWEVSQKPSYSLLKVYLDPGESVTAEPGAMVMYRGNVQVKTHTGGGLFKGITRALLGGESVFMNTFIAGSGGGEIWFAPSLPGDIQYHELRGEELIIQDTSYLANHGNIDLGVAWRGFRGLLAEGELFWLKAKGYGGVWISAYGGIERIDLGPGESMILDNFHFVAMTSSLQWRVRKFGGLKSFLLGGEGIVIELTGPGTVYVQTRALPPFVGLISKYIKK